MKLIRTDLLLHIEDYSEKRVNNMKEKMVSGGIWEKPICVEKNHFLVLDGQHRFEVSRLLGLNYIPCELFDYGDEELLTWSLRKECVVSKNLVISKSLSKDIYPYKTAKHKFPRKIEKCLISIDDLLKIEYSDEIIMDYK
jgi:L-serine kinase (ADP)